MSRHVIHPVPARVFLALVFALILLLPFPAGAVSFQSGFTPIVLPDVTIVALGSRPIDRDLRRGLHKLGEELRQVYAKAAKIGLHKGPPARLIVCLDYEFPVPEYWRACGLEPDEAYFARLRQELLHVNDLPTDLAVREEEKNRLWRQHPHLTGLPPLAYRKDEGRVLLAADPEEVDAFIARLRETLGRPMGKAGEVYQINRKGVFETNAFLYGTGCVYIDGRGLKSPSRIFDHITHEVGHHLFENHFLHKVRREFGIAATTQALLFRYQLSDLDELFADYLAVSNGSNVVWEVNRYRGMKIPQDFKRYFSDDRTLADFLAKSQRDKSTTWLYTEPHNRMNPSRSFLWKVKLALGLPMTDRLFIDAVNRRLRTFFQVDVPRLPHLKTLAQVDDRYILDGYPEDITTANLRFVTEFSAAARQFLSANQQAEYDRIGTHIFGSVFPRSATGH